MGHGQTRTEEKRLKPPSDTARQGRNPKTKTFAQRHRGHTETTRNLRFEISEEGREKRRWTQRIGMSAVQRGKAATQRRRRLPRGTEDAQRRRGISDLKFQKREEKKALGGVKFAGV
jgi:hypothetical protein